MVGQTPSGTLRVPPPSEREALRGAVDVAPYDGTAYFVIHTKPTPKKCPKFREMHRQTLTRPDVR